MENSYIKMYRGLIGWEWYKNSNMVHLFIHLLLKANYIDGRFQGKEVKRGQLITGRKRLSEDTGISSQSIRTCLTKLKSTNEITIQSTNDYSLITIVKYNDYQDYDKKSTNKSTNKLTNDQPTSNQQVTTIEERKEEKEIKFDLFWTLYPNKVAKQKCKDKFLKLDIDVINKILNTLPNFSKYKPFESYTHPNPETYLNQKRWEDEIPTEKKNYVKIDLSGL
jgi:hypothetical protein